MYQLMSGVGEGCMCLFNMGCLVNHYICLKRWGGCVEWIIPIYYRRYSELIMERYASGCDLGMGCGRYGMYRYIAKV